MNGLRGMVTNNKNKEINNPMISLAGYNSD
jgi:hypothetical protein